MSLICRVCDFEFLMHWYSENCGVEMKWKVANVLERKTEFWDWTGEYSTFTLPLLWIENQSTKKSTRKTNNDDEKKTQRKAANFAVNWAFECYIVSEHFVICHSERALSFVAITLLSLCSHFIGCWCCCCCCAFHSSWCDVCYFMFVYFGFLFLLLSLWPNCMVNVFHLFSFAFRIDFHFLYSSFHQIHSHLFFVYLLFRWSPKQIIRATNLSSTLSAWCSFNRSADWFSFSLSLLHEFINQ